MSPIAMAALLVGSLAFFAITASKRWQLLMMGRPSGRFDRLSERVGAVWRYAFRQEKMDYYQPAGLAHKFIFVGFVVLLLRTLILWGRGFVPNFNLFILEPTGKLGQAYEFAKDSVAILVLFGVSVFVYYRVVKPQKRMTLSAEGLLILGIIGTMMIADMLYDGASMTLSSRAATICGPEPTGTPEQCAAIETIIAPYGRGAHVEWAIFPSPGGSAMAVLVRTLSPGALIVLAHVGFWLHSSLVLLFLNLLPRSKHFHVITAIPNVFTRELGPPGRLRPMAENAEKLMEQVGAAAEHADPTSMPIGIARPEHFTWKSILDFYTCTECGRCSDNCPAHRTGKILSPKHYLLAMRDYLYEHEKEFVEALAQPRAATPAAPPNGAPVGDPSGDGSATDGMPPSVAPTAAADPKLTSLPSIDLVPNIVHPDVLWACTTCRACEEQCPVMISYVDKIVDMRRNLVMIKGEFPHTLQKPFQGMEVNGNPWNLSRMDRSAWSDGLGVATMAEKPTATILYWVGCAASYDDRAKKIARATAKLLQKAKVDFAVLGQEESCTGDPARRAGNEFLFAMLAEGNAATLNGYKEQGGMKQVVTACPHCFNTLKNEYPDVGCKLEVIHHADFLLALVAEGRLVPKNPVTGRVVYHDSCYLGRYNGVYESPREILRRIPGVELVEPEYWTKQRGLCCGAGGAQMWMEEQNQNRVNVKRTLQLVDTGAKTIASACPFCMTMLTDGLKSHSLEETIRQLDIAELLDLACADDVALGGSPPEPSPPAPEEVAAE